MVELLLMREFVPSGLGVYLSMLIGKGLEDVCPNMVYKYMNALYTVEDVDV
jgi:hypothetical protein